PYGVFSHDGEPPRVGVRIGDFVLDLAPAAAAEMLEVAQVFEASDLNPLMALGRPTWDSVRSWVTSLLTDETERSLVEPLLPNWRHLPVGYHGRAGTVVVSGTPVTRPCGQRKPPSAEVPSFGPTTRLDIETELGFLVGRPSEMGSGVPVDAFSEHVFGVLALNDWSARDIQAWEYVPLGPFLGKSFATSVSGWVTPLAALDAARVDLPGQDPEPLDYLQVRGPAGYDIEFEVLLNGATVARPPYRSMYWSPAQMLAHLTVNGASLRTGDLFASGTVSGPGRDQRGSFLELSWGGKEPFEAAGARRTFLEDGDQVTIRATAPGARGGRIALGEVTGTILPAR
ncbi:MAG: fumarylacetoacetate hydrolase family protein, partial [Nocardioidaceae bacterium]